MNVYTEDSATQQTLFDETRTYRRVYTDLFLASIIAPPYFSHVHKRNGRHVTAAKVRGIIFVQLFGRSALIAPINGTVAQRSCDQQYWENIQHVL